MADFLLYALLAGLALAIVAGPLGSFVVWRRMAYFGDTLSHAALLGVAMGFLLDVSPTIAVTVGCLLLAVLLVTLQQRQSLASDTLLGILAPSTLSLGLVVLSFMHEVRIDLMAYLFGDLLAISPTDLMWILGGSAAVLVLLVALWRPLLAITVHEELAMVEGLPVAALRLALMLLIAVALGELAEDLGHGTAEQILGNAHADGHRPGRVGERRCSFLLQGQDSAGVAQQPLSSRRGLERPCRAIHQGLAHRLLQPRKLLADGRLRHMQPLRREREAARVDDGNKGAQQAWIKHGVGRECAMWRARHS